MGQDERDEPVIRLISNEDSIADLTDLLHRAYAPLAARGMHFVASHQDAQRTRERTARGECYLAVQDGSVIGTITVRSPQQTRGCPWYDRPEVACFGQFAVEPAWQKRGLGSRLLCLAEQRAAETGAAELALDTAEPAAELISYYMKRGYRFIEYAQWNTVNYRSVILSKPVAAPPDTSA